jgi:hypothetical protein
MAIGQDVLRLFNNARMRVNGATDDVLQYELFNAMDDFFKGSNAWQEDIDITIPAGDAVGTLYDIVPDTPSVIDKLMWVYEVPTSPTILRGPPVTAYMQTPGLLSLAVQPSSSIAYRVTVALTVQDPVTKDGYVQFPAWVLAKYRNVILDGLLGKMFSQPNKPWTNSQMSVFHMRRFNSKVASARVEVQRNNKYRAQAWVFPGFARGSQRGGTGWGGPV